MNSTEKYIFKNIGKTVKPSKIGMKPFTVPCIGEMFTDFYYWDTYFTNLALIEMSNFKQTENNLDNMKLFVEELGYIPNSDITINRSQPPLFARGVFDYYCACGKNIRIAEKYLSAMVKEHEFWMRERMLPCGLNGYRHNADREYLTQFCMDIADRVGEDVKKYPDKAEQGAHFLAIAESGWDFTPRFQSGDNRYAGMDYAPVDLNAILFDAEHIIARLASDMGNVSLAEEYCSYAETRKARMTDLMSGKDGLLYDYNVREERLSTLRHAGMFVPFAVGILQDTALTEELLSSLEGEYGIAACAYRGEDKYDQWDYPSIWPPLVYFCVEGLRVSKSQRFFTIAEKYISTVDGVYKKTGLLWEKYNVATGGVASSAEYGTPPMMGWTAGVYLYLNAILAQNTHTYKRYIGGLK